MTIGENAARDPEERGRLFEVAVGSILDRLPGNLYYWRDGDREIDFVYTLGKSIWGIEVKSSQKKEFDAFIEDPDRFLKA